MSLRDHTALNEVEDCGILRELVQEMGLYRNLTPFLVNGRDTTTGQNVALMSKFDAVQPAVAILGKSKFPVPGSACPLTSTGGAYGPTKVLHVVLVVPGLARNVSVYAVHMLSPRSGHESCFKREAAAVVLSDTISRDENHVILVGDMNEDYNGPVTKVILRNTALKAVKGYKATFKSGSRKLLLDHVYLDPELFEIVHRVEVFINTVSDHYPVVVDLKLKDIKYEL